MEYKTIVTIHRKGKAISLFLKEGESLTYENIVDVQINEGDALPCNLFLTLPSQYA
jgi:hypothetical protein